MIIIKIIMAAILSGTEFDATNDFIYTKAKVQANGRKQVGILNNNNKKSFYLSTPLMLTWGCNEFVDEQTGRKSYDMVLQFPNDEYNNQDTVAFLKNMQKFENKIKEDAITNSKDWLNKTKLVPDAVDALWSNMLKYPKDKESGDPDYSRPPSLKVKIPYWEGEIKGVELYDDNQNLLFPKNESDNIMELITKGSNVATIIQCGGIWVANGKFGVTWKLFQAVVKPRTTLSGKCHIMLSDKDKEKLNVEKDPEESEAVSPKETAGVNSLVGDSDEDEEEEQAVNVEEVKEEVKEEVTKAVSVEDVKKPKKVVKKKAVTAS